MSEALTSVPQENPTFRLAGGSSGFCHRSRDIFAQLDSAAKLTSKDLGEDNILDGTFARPAPPSPPPQAAKRKCGQETTKKQPPVKKLPDYLGHPERWTHYSLEDHVTEMLRPLTYCEACPGQNPSLTRQKQ
uniref:Protein TSSC4 n=1 Tax=Cyprinus carpio TaxID=7962 RepID=A0A8C2KVI7_CYPCA